MECRLFDVRLLPIFLLSFLSLNCNQENPKERSVFDSDSPIEISKESPYALTMDFTGVSGGEVFEASFYKSTPNPMVQLVADGGWDNHYFQTGWYTKEGEHSYKVSARIVIPEGVNSDIRFFAHNASSEKCLVENMVIDRYKTKKESLLKAETFYPFLYALLNDYHIRNYKELAWESILSYSREPHINELLLNHSITQVEFEKTFHHLSRGENPIVEGLRKMKSEMHYDSVTFKEEEGMKIIRPAGYIENMFCLKSDIAKVVLQDEHLLKSVKIFKLEKNYEFKSVNVSHSVSDNILSIPCTDLDRGIYKIQLEGEKSSFPIPLIVNSFSDNKTVILAPYSTWHAYNAYAGKSLYKNGIDDQDVNYVSTRRPITSIHFDDTFLGHDIFILNNMFDWFDENYGADLLPDYYLEAHPELIEKYNTIILAQHCEYFSASMYTH